MMYNFFNKLTQMCINSHISATYQLSNMINLLIDQRHVSPAMCVILTLTDVVKCFI